MKEALKKIADVLKLIFGYGIMISLFMGALIFLGYVVALICGGESAAEICDFIKTVITPIMIYISTSMVILGLIAMYLAGELALTVGKKASRKEGER